MTTDVRRVALITGGRRGIGRAIAYAMAVAGYDVVVNDIGRDDEGEMTLAGIEERGGRAHFIAGDISRIDDHDDIVDAAHGAFGRLDCLINNAGVQVPVRGDLLDVTPDDFDWVMGINIRGTFFLTQAVARRMLMDDDARAGRAIVTITSANATMASVEKSPYCISKAALSMATRLFALRLAEYGIDVFEVRPGLINTDMTATVRETYGARIRNGISPIARWGEPDDVAKAVVGLATGLMPFSTGHAFNIDGGLQIARL